jgi:hypothetical protein
MAPTSESATASMTITVSTIDLVLKKSRTKTIPRVDGIES